MLRLSRGKDQFLEMLSEMCADLVQGAELLGKALRDVERADVYSERLKDVEHHCDQTVHEIVRALNRSYFSSVSREDWHALASRLDDVLDAAWKSADRLLVYRITEVPAPALRLAEVILAQSEELAAAVAALGQDTQSLSHCNAVKQLEADADQIAASAVSELFSNGNSPITVIKLRDLYRGLEGATDSAKQAADLIESVALKRGAA
jgi:uncharacterized protein Yka (UPF0111/DUF47 family)